MKIGIIGAGVAGLAAARLLDQAGFDCQVFERGSRVGGVWTVGYHTYGLQTPRQLYEIPDWPMPAWYPVIPSGEQIQEYLASYARHFGLGDRIRFRTRVNALVPGPGGSGWVVRYTDEQDGGTGEQAFDHLVVATGLYSNPKMPEFPDREQFRGEVIHSSAYSTPDLVAGRKVIVLGFGKSGLDVAVDASKNATETTLLFREAHWPVPVKVLGLVGMHKLFLTRVAGGFLPLYPRPAAWEQALHQNAPWLVHGFWRLTERLLRFQFRLDACDVVPQVPLERDVFNGGVLPTDESFPLLCSGAVRPRRGTIARYVPDGVELADGTHVEADMVIMATGWQCDYSMFPEAFGRVVDDDGLYLYRHVLHPDWADLSFIGWASTFSNSLTSHLTALWLSRLLQGKVTLPPGERMRQEIAEMKQWKRRIMPAIGSRASMLQLHMWHFHDDLLRDMGIEPGRKRNMLAEMLEDYGPADYADLFRAPDRA